MGNCFCGDEGVVFLHYARKHLCAPHFVRMFDRRFRRTVRMEKMVRRGERVAVGLSGGKDSTVLLHSLAQLRDDLPMELVAITIDEGISGYRERTLAIAKRECDALEVEQVVVSAKEMAGATMDELVKRNPETIPCTQCGVLRRRLLGEAAKELRADRLAVGHNLDDLAQTLMMNIMRGEPMRIARVNESGGLFVPRIRPLMTTPEREVAIYAMLKDIELESVECPYAASAFRSHVRKMLNEAEEKYPGTKFKIAGSSSELEGALRKAKPAAKLSKCSSCGMPCSKGTCMFCSKIRPGRRRA